MSSPRVAKCVKDERHGWRKRNELSYTTTKTQCSLLRGVGNQFEINMDNAWLERERDTPLLVCESSRDFWYLRNIGRFLFLYKEVIP